MQNTWRESAYFCKLENRVNICRCLNLTILLKNEIVISELFSCQQEKRISHSKELWPKQKKFKYPNGKKTQPKLKALNVHILFHFKWMGKEAIFQLKMHFHSKSTKNQY